MGAVSLLGFALLSGLALGSLALVTGACSHTHLRQCLTLCRLSSHPIHQVRSPAVILASLSALFPPSGPFTTLIGFSLK